MMGVEVQEGGIVASIRLQEGNRKIERQRNGHKRPRQGTWGRWRHNNHLTTEEIDDSCTLFMHILLTPQ